jgi:CheY-like chemotaxis protein
VELARTLRPDVIVMDLAMPGIGGLDATRQITPTTPNLAC